MNGAARRNLVLATVAFTISFALWGLISGLAPIFKAWYGLSATETSLIVAIPVLLGSLGRIPVGLLTDRFGGRIVFAVVLMFGIVPALALAADHSYQSLLLWGLLLGVMGTSFAVGVAFVAPWFPAEKQGAALGVYGAGNIGQSIAVFGAPFLAGTIGIAATLPLFGIASLAWGLVFALVARNAVVAGPPKTVGENLQVFRHEPVAWILSIFYFLTFGGFVALSIYLPALLRDMYDLTVEDAGARTAGFVMLATLSRPIGGWIADRIGGVRLLIAVFFGLAGMAWLLIFPSIYLFSVGALGAAACLGLGNGGVFKLVPRYFPRNTGTVTGLVGAAGGLGGFFPPIVLGLFRDITGSYTPGFALFSIFASGCLMVLFLLPAFNAPESETKPERLMVLEG